MPKLFPACAMAHSSGEETGLAFPAMEVSSTTQQGSDSSTSFVHMTPVKEIAGSFSQSASGAEPGPSRQYGRTDSRLRSQTSQPPPPWGLNADIFPPSEEEAKMASFTAIHDGSDASGSAMSRRGSRRPPRSRGTSVSPYPAQVTDTSELVAEEYEVLPARDRSAVAGRQVQGKGAGRASPARERGSPTTVARAWSPLDAQTAEVEHFAQRVLGDQDANMGNRGPDLFPEPSPS